MAWYNATMVSKLNLDRAGRVVLPKPIRDQFQLEPGESLELESFDDHIVLRPVRVDAPLRKKRGVWVFGTGKPLAASTADETLRRVREDRDDEITGRRG